MAGFWGPALGYSSIGTCGNFVALISDGRPGPKLLLQRVEEPKSTKNRMHVDIEVTDIQAEADRLVALGATRTREAPLREHASSWLPMVDPEGNEFCVCDGGHGDADNHDKEGQG